MQLYLWAFTKNRNKSQNLKIKITITTKIAFKMSEIIFYVGTYNIHVTFVKKMPVRL